jgi:hypothetical protein
MKLTRTCPVRFGGIFNVETQTIEIFKATINLIPAAKRLPLVLHFTHRIRHVLQKAISSFPKSAKNETQDIELVI